MADEKPKDEAYLGWMKVKDLMTCFHEDNPKKHDIPSLIESIKTFGFKEQPLIDEKTGKVAAGHGRTTALNQMETEKMTRPSDVRVDEDGDWIVQVTRGKSFTSPEELRAYLIVSNRTTERGGWDAEKTYDIVVELEDNPVLFDVLGYSDAEIEVLEANARPLDVQDGVTDNSQSVEPKKAENVSFQFGEYRFLVPRDYYDKWLEQLRLDIGFENPVIVKHLAGRVGVETYTLR